MNPWLVAILSGLVMFAMRATVPLVVRGAELPERIVTTSRLAAPAVVGALLASSLAPSVVEPRQMLERLAVLAVGLAVALRTQSLPWTLAAGFGAHVVVGVIA